MIHEVEGKPTECAVMGAKGRKGFKVEGVINCVK